jgi:hypothetical protein
MTTLLHLERRRYGNVVDIIAAWRVRSRVWRVVPSSSARGDDKNQNVVVRGATDRLRRNFKS